MTDSLVKKMDADDPVYQLLLAGDKDYLIYTLSTM